MAYEAFIGEIMMWGGNFAPRNWAFCDGQLINIDQNPALFSLLGITYGGDGYVQFALPDLRGRVPMHRGQGPGLNNVALGEQGGEESCTFDAAPTCFQEYEPQFPAIAVTSLPTNEDYKIVKENRQPYLGLNFVICVNGIYPSRP